MSNTFPLVLFSILHNIKFVFLFVNMIIGIVLSKAYRSFCSDKKTLAQSHDIK